jgi:hypothetical protein
MMIPSNNAVTQVMLDRKPATTKMAVQIPSPRACQNVHTQIKHQCLLISILGNAILQLKWKLDIPFAFLPTVLSQEKNP